MENGTPKTSASSRKNECECVMGTEASMNRETSILRLSEKRRSTAPPPWPNRNVRQDETEASITSNAMAARSWREKAFSGTATEKKTRAAKITATTARNRVRESVLYAKYPSPTAEAKTLLVRRTTTKSPARRTVRNFERSKAKNAAGSARTEKNASEFGLPKVQNARPLPHSGKTTYTKTGSNQTD